LGVTTNRTGPVPHRATPDRTEPHRTSVVRYLKLKRR